MERTTPNVADAGIWGRLTGEGRSAAVIRFILPDRTISFPYHALTRWEYAVGETETLLVFAGTNTITVRGRHLGPLRDGLDRARLEQVRVQGERAALRATPNEPWIQAITVRNS